MADIILKGADCSAVLTAETVTVRGDYYRYDLHKRRRVSGSVTVDLLQVLRVGITKTYSRLMFAIPMGFGMLAVFINAFPSISLLGMTFWSIPHQDELWKLCAVACLLTIPLYWLSYRDDLEINTMQGRYLLPRKGMNAAEISSFQREFTRRKEARQRAKK